MDRALTHPAGAGRAGRIGRLGGAWFRLEWRPAFKSFSRSTGIESLEIRLLMKLAEDQDGDNFSDNLIEFGSDKLVAGFAEALLIRARLASDRKRARHEREHGP